MATVAALRSRRAIARKRGSRAAPPSPTVTSAGIATPPIAAAENAKKSPRQQPINVLVLESPNRVPAAKRRAKITKSPIPKTKVNALVPGTAPAMSKTPIARGLSVTAWDTPLGEATDATSAIAAT